MPSGRRPLRVLVVGPKYASDNSRGGMATIVSLMRERRDSRIRITTIATYVDGSRCDRLLVGVVGMVHATARVLMRRVDVLHVHLAHRGSVVRKALPLLAARWVGVPAVIHAHSYDFAGWFDGLPGFTQRVVRLVLPAQRWLTLGAGLAEDYRAMLQLPADRVMAVPNPVFLPPERPVPTVSEGSIVRIASLGRLGERKGSYDLVMAVQRLDPTIRSRIRVVVAGDGEIDDVRKAAADAGIADVLEVRSWLDSADRDKLLADSEIFVLPSYAEGLPMALLEAMAWGLVPVVTPVGAIPEIVEDTVHAVLVPPGDVAAITLALECLVTDPALRRRMGRAARERVAAFELDAWFEQLIALWTSISDPSGPGGSTR